MNDEENKEEREVKEIRHTISAEEAYTLGKDIFDIRCFIKSVYNNRAQIARRLNLLSFIFSIVFTLLYVAYMLFGGLLKKLSLGWTIAVYAVLGAYALLTILLLSFSIAAGKNNSTKKSKKYSKTLKFFRYAVRLSSLAMGIVSLAMSASGGTKDAVGIAVDTVAIIISIVFIIFSAIPLVCGGFGGMARWLLSPAKIKRKFSFVVLEWYQLLVNGGNKSKAVQKVSSEYMDDIARIVDNVLIPTLGKKYMTSITVNNIYSAISKAGEEDRYICEGVIKNVFSYATECGYVTFNPCKDMELEGSIEVEEKPKKESLKNKIIKKAGMSILSKVLGKSDKSSASDSDPSPQDK
jgi:hypothetical protein